MPEYEVRYRDAKSGEDKCERFSAYDADEAVAQFKLSRPAFHGFQVIETSTGKILFHTPDQTPKPSGTTPTTRDKPTAQLQSNQRWSRFHLISWCITALGIFSLLLSMSLRGSRVGAECNDGWNSHATGRGACSHHDGVDYWKYENQTAAGLVCPSTLFTIVGGVCLWCAYARD